MHERKFLTRRDFLRLSALAGTAAALSACTQAPSPSPTRAPEPSATSLPQGSKAPPPTAAAAAALPTPAPTKAPEPTRPAPVAAAPTPAPAATAVAKVAEKPGKHLIGKLEGPEIVTDPAKFPRKYNEAPVLAELVKAGKLPPVEKRLPEEPLVIKPVHGVGKYGGTWRRAFAGPGDQDNMGRVSAPDKPLFFEYTGIKNAPCIAKDWKVSDGGRSISLYLRKGHKWSDGEPFTADDFVFWWQDIYQNKDFSATNPELFIKGQPGTMEKIDDHSIAYKFPEPYFLFVDVLSGDSWIGRGQGGGAVVGIFAGAYAPKHYLKQFLPKYVGKEESDKKVREGGFDGLASMMKFKTNWQLNKDLPVITMWKMTSPINSPSYVLERNPFFYEVDTEGNQLPYIDRVQLTLGENLEVINLRAIAGEYDYQERHTDLSKLPVYLENQAKGNYKVYLDPASAGGDTALFVNVDHDADTEVGKWLRNREFRRALSLGIDRDQLNEAFWLGIGTPGSVVPDGSLPQSPGAEWRKKWSVYDPKQANELLDKAGLDKKDAEGYRLRTDGKGRLRLEMMTVGGQFLPWPQQAEMIAQQWKKIGIQGDAKEVERNLAFTKAENNEHQIGLWTNMGSEHIFLYPQWALPANSAQAWMAPLVGKWYASNGEKGRKPTDPQLVKALELFRSAAGLQTEERNKTAQEIWQIIVEEQWDIGVVGLGPAVLGVRVVKNNVANAPARQLNVQYLRNPGGSHPETFYFKQ